MLRKTIQAFTLFALLSTPIASFSSEASVITGQKSHFNNLIEAQGLKQVIQAITRNDSDTFNKSFTHTTEIIQLKNGTKFLEGWDNNEHTKTRAALFIHPHGGVSAALFDISRNRINYYSNNTETNQDTSFQAWVRIFAPTITSPNQNHHDTKTLRKKSEWDNTHGEQNLRKIASLIWDYDGSKISTNWEMNEEVTSIIVRAVNEINSCTRSARLIYMPGTILNNGVDIFSQALDIIDFIRAIATNRRAESCIVMTASRWRSPIEMASMGI